MFAKSDAGEGKTRRYLFQNMSYFLRLSVYNPAEPKM